MTDPTPTPDPTPEPGADQPPQTFTQADVDRIVTERIKRVEAKYADYGDLKTKAEGAKTAEERIGLLEQEIQATKHEALKRRVQAEHGISNEDADLFLTGADEDALIAQAKRLADRESERKKKNNVSPSEGKTPATGTQSSWSGVLRQLDDQRQT